MQTLLALAITFLSPLAGSQAIGVQPIEVTTTVAAVDRVDFYVDDTLIGTARKPPYRILHDFGTALDAHKVTARVYSNQYRTTTSESVMTAAMSAGETLTIDFVEVPLRVKSSRKLRAEDLRIRENGKEQSIREVRADRGPARFVFVVDRSLSMSGGRLQAALKAIDAEKSQLRRDDRSELVVFNHIVTRDPKLPVTASGGTALRDAVSAVAGNDRTYVIVITDGGDRNSETTEAEALKKISRTRTVVDAIILGDRSPFLEKAAKNTGGTLAHATASTIQRELHKIFLDINSRYTAAYQSNVHTPGWRSIDVSSRRRDTAILNARKGYFSQ
jgi:Mg-chelatase subunit ChlD